MIVFSEGERVTIVSMRKVRTQRVNFQTATDICDFMILIHSFIPSSCYRLSEVSRKDSESDI